MAAAATCDCLPIYVEGDVYLSTIHNLLERTQVNVQLMKFMEDFLARELNKICDVWNSEKCDEERNDVLRIFDESCSGTQISPRGHSYFHFRVIDAKETSLDDIKTSRFLCSDITKDSQMISRNFGVEIAEIWPKSSEEYERMFCRVRAKR